MRVQNGKVAAQCDREFVILNAVKDLAFFILRFFTREAQNDRVRGFVILSLRRICFFHIEILRKRGSE